MKKKGKWKAMCKKGFCHLGLVDEEGNEDRKKLAKKSNDRQRKNCHDKTLKTMLATN